jgi:hypothetical protein
MSASLRALLAENRTRDPEFGHGLSNHQSMALGALAALGADQTRLAAFADHYAPRLRPCLRLRSAFGSPETPPLSARHRRTGPCSSPARSRATTITT